jgi:hypothetical protein
MWIHYCGVYNTRSENATNLQRKCNQLSTITLKNMVCYIDDVSSIKQEHNSKNHAKTSNNMNCTEPLCNDNKSYNHVCQVILFSLYFNKHVKLTKLKELRNTVDGILRLQSKSPLDDDTWRACMKILNDKGLIAIWS